MGIELGSTRIKAVIIDESRKVIASGSHSWESRQIGGYWSYSLDDVQSGLKDAVSKLPIAGCQLSAMGVSAMMHGYLVFDKEDNLLVPFRTWKNTTAGEAAEKLTELFDFNIPERWSAAHLYQTILNGEEHVKDIAFITTLAGYVHWKLTGEKAIGVCDASGMFPVRDNGWNPEFVEKFKGLTGIDWSRIAPEILPAGKNAGTLTAAGRQYLFGETSGLLSSPCILCPPEGDAGTGMVSCNAVAPRTGNVSAGTSVFAMVVLDKPLKRLHKEVDIVTTPDGRDVAMVHYNECTSKIDPWVKLFGEAFDLFGLTVDTGELYQKLYEVALENSTKLSEFMHGVIASAISGLADGMRILTVEEQVKVERLAGHGGFFKSGNAGKRIMSEMLGIPIELSETAAEGGAWGIALLADYLKCADEKTLSEYLEEKNA
ncbi:MAG TPA: FGGY family carbohydrate kinase [Bacillota bacterium]|nr:FGGY family carbohydrate kinase [Bacillota bacterium]